MSILRNGMTNNITKNYKRVFSIRNVVIWLFSIKKAIFNFVEDAMWLICAMQKRIEVMFGRARGF